MIIIAATVVTGRFQLVLNQAFKPLLEFLPHIKGSERLKPENFDEDA